MKRKMKWNLLLAMLLIAMVIPGNTVEAAAFKKPAKVKITSVKASGPSAITVKWKKVSKAKGYQVCIAKDKKFKKGKKTVAATAKSKSITGLSTSTTYFVKVRAYSKKGSKKKYGSWSAVKKVTTAKKAAAEQHTHNWVAITAQEKAYEIVPFSEAKNPPSADNKYRCMCESCKKGNVAYQQLEVLDLMKEHMEEVNSPGWYEEIWSSHQICGKCGLDLTAAGMTVNEMGMHELECRASRYSDMRVDYCIEHKSTLTDRAVTVIKGYRCSTCGATK